MSATEQKKPRTCDPGLLTSKQDTGSVVGASKQRRKLYHDSPRCCKDPTVVSNLQLVAKIQHSAVWSHAEARNGYFFDQAMCAFAQTPSEKYASPSRSRPRPDSLCVWNVRPLKFAFWSDRPNRLPLYSQAGGAEGRRSRPPKQEGPNCPCDWSTSRIPDKRFIAVRLPCPPAGLPKGRAKGSACAMTKHNRRKQR